jgi:heme/copper-type cytochrome/quinol oxidase subunit 3
LCPRARGGARYRADVLKESRGGDHKEVVQISLRYGMVLFIASEVMFFVAWFWGFFEMAIFHDLRGSAAHTDLANPNLENLKHSGRSLKLLPTPMARRPTCR